MVFEISVGICSLKDSIRNSMGDGGELNWQRQDSAFTSGCYKVVKIDIAFMSAGCCTTEHKGQMHIGNALLELTKDNTKVFQRYVEWETSLSFVDANGVITELDETPSKYCTQSCILFLEAVYDELHAIVKTHKSKTDHGDLMSITAHRNSAATDVNVLICALKVLTAHPRDFSGNALCTRSRSHAS